MSIRQLSIFLENRKGRLAAMTRILANAGIDICAMSIADTSEFGIVRIIVNDVEGAEKVLKDNNVSVHVNDVTAVEVDGRPGGLCRVLSLLDNTSINVEYMYTMAQHCTANPVLVLRFSEAVVAREILRTNGIHLLDENELGVK